ncbi:hypothetical protein CYCD_19340 [Tenuifilaceae bacterium CYCD]|nr:hypothetical protein CYCD_19340 [Tenuifilaceae bacterium CYCD]
MIRMKALSIKILVLLVLAFLVVSCFNSKGKPKPIARVYDKYLYSTDIKDLILQGTSKEDSVLVTKAYVEKWVQTQLLLRMAEQNLSDSQKNVARQLEDYRTSLLIFKYEQEYVNQKMDTSVNYEELRKYYDEHKDNFILDETIVKALYIKLRKEAPQVARIKELYKSMRDEDIKQLDNLAYQASIKYDYFGDKWISLPFILREIPFPIDDPDDLLSKQRSIDMEDGDFVYLVSFREVLFKGSVAPYDYVIDGIKEIVLNTRKQNLIQSLEQNLYNKAQDNMDFQKY